MAKSQKQINKSAPKRAAEKTPVMGRPRKEIDYAVFEGLCRIQCTEVEIASIFQVDIDTLNARLKENYGETFSEVYKKYSASGRISLRRAQIKAAENGNPTMLIWLGKQYLGQRDQIDHKVEVSSVEAAKQAMKEIMHKFELQPEVAAPIIAEKFGISEAELISEREM
jgi:hypothetical protein